MRDDANAFGIFPKLSWMLASAGFLALLWPTHCVGDEAGQATVASLEQEKPACIVETAYFKQPGGFDPVRVIHAYPEYRGDLNESNFPTSLGIVVNSKVNRDRGPAMLVSVESILATDMGLEILASPTFAISITNEPSGEYSKSRIQILGLCNRMLERVSYDIRHPLNQQYENLPGYITYPIFNLKRWTNMGTAFACLVELAPGTNIVRLHLNTRCGQVLSTNLTYVLNLQRDHTPPRFNATWPTNGQSISGRTFSMHGNVDDNNAVIRARVIGGGQTNIVTGLTLRDGRFWIEHLPLSGNSNLISVAAIDPAGNAATTDMTLFQSRTRLTIDPVPERQLFQLRVQVTGSVNPPDQEVWVNGKQAEVGSDGRWVANRVPVTKGGLGIFNAIAISRKTAAPSILPPEEVVSIQAKMPAQPLTLNLSQPACGIFQLHIEGAEGRPFVLSTSSNLVDWTPILTNRSASPFSYSDTNAAAYGCKFFRVIPAD